MRTKEEIKAYLKENGHTSVAIAKITGFLIGKDIKLNKEQFVVKKGEGTWEEFYAWYNKESLHVRPLIYHVFAALFDAKDKATDKYDKERINAVIDYLVAEYVFDTTTNERCVRKNKSR